MPTMTIEKLSKPVVPTFGSREEAVKALAEATHKHFLNIDDREAERNVEAIEAVITAQFKDSKQIITTATNLALGHRKG